MSSSPEDISNNRSGNEEPRWRRLIDILSQPGGLFVSVVILAFVVRIAFIAVYPASRLGGDDSTAYWSFAQGIAKGDGFRSTFEPWLADRPPLYPYFIALVMRTIGPNPLAIYVIQAILGALSAGLFGLEVRHLANTRTGQIAGVMFALWPHFLLFTKQILTENLYIFLYVQLLAILLLPARGNNRKFRWWQWSVAGLFIGLLTLERREGLLPAVMILIVTAYRNYPEHWRPRLQSAAWALFVAGLTILPWLVRNQIELGSFTLSSSSGVNLMVGNNPLADGSYSTPPASWQAQFSGLTELDRDKLAWQLSLNWIGQNPRKFIQLLPKKVIALLSPANNIIPDTADLLLLPFALIGLIILIRQLKTQWLALFMGLLPIISSLVIALIFVGGWRYRLLMYVGLLLMAAYGIDEVIAYIRKVSINQKSLSTR